MLIKVQQKFIKNIKEYKYNFYINKELNLFIYNKYFFINFLLINNIKYINIDENKNYYYLINDVEVFKYFNAKEILLKIKDKL